jgi:serine phosphatase RsbU (regulator of sigma subunit)
MPPDDDTLEEQTLSFRRPANTDANARTSEPVHLLLLLDDNAPPKRLPLHVLPVVVGRNPPSDLILEDATVSRRHCKLEVRDGQLLLSDLGSTNGTFVDAVRLTEPTRLQDGASIGIGAFRLRYHRRERDETADADAMDQEWREASKYVASILPRPIGHGPVRANWFYQPSTRIAGDAFGYQMLDERHFSLFLLDVSGHGTGAAMHAMTVAQVLRERVLPHVDFLDPAAVISGLNARFPMARNNDLFFTIWYGVYDIVDRVLTYAAGGHHAAYLLTADATGPGIPNGAPLPLLTQSPLVGMLSDPEFAAAKVAVPPGSTLHLFSDGVFEIIDRDGRQLGLTDILPMLPSIAAAEAPDDPRRLYERIRAIARPGQLDDDFSALVFRFT